jgi:hypothetical protein
VARDQLRSAKKEGPNQGVRAKSIREVMQPASDTIKG